eukprot:m51a1_g12426 putative polyprotein (796) ;mRNA; r:793343-797342
MLRLEPHESVAQEWAEILQTVFLISDKDFTPQQLDYALLTCYPLFKKQVEVITQDKKLECSKGHSVAGRLHDTQWSRQWADWGDPEMAQCLANGVPWRSDLTELAPAFFAYCRSIDRYVQQTRDKVSSLWAMQAVDVYNATMVAKYGYPHVIAPLHMEEQAGKLRLCFNSCYTNKCDGSGKVHFSLLDDICHTMLKHKLFSKIDVRSGYHHIAVPEADAPWLCFSLDGVIYYWCCVMFGMCSVPRWFTHMTAVIVTVLRVVLGCPLIVYIDNFVLFLGNDPGHAQQCWKAAWAILLAFGLVMAVDKACPPAPHIEALGLALDSTLLRIELSAAWAGKLRIGASAVLAQQARAYVPASALACLAGHLCSSSAGLWYGRRLAQPLYNLLHPLDSEALRVVRAALSQRACKACALLLLHWEWLLGRDVHEAELALSLVTDSTLRQWAATLWQCTGACKACALLLLHWEWLLGRDVHEAELALSLVTDSTLRQWAATLVQPSKAPRGTDPRTGHAVAMHWASDDDRIITIKEAWAVVLGAQALAPDMRCMPLLIHVDNIVAMYYLAKGGSRMAQLADAAWELTTWLLGCHNYAACMRFFECWYETNMGPLTVELLECFFIDCFDSSHFVRTWSIMCECTWAACTTAKGEAMAAIITIGYVFLLCWSKAADIWEGHGHMVHGLHGYTLYLDHSKTDVLAQGVSMFFPFKSLLGKWLSRVKWALARICALAPLVADINSHLKAVLRQQACFHGLHHGSCSDLLATNTPKSELQELGRWCSVKAMTLYCHAESIEQQHMPEV